MRLVIIGIIYIICPFVLAVLFHKLKLARQVGTVMMAYAVGIVMALTGFVNLAGSDAITLQKIQTIIMNIAVPLAIPLMLFSCDFGLWVKSLPKTALVLGGGILSVLIAIISAFFIFRHAGIEGFANVAGMMTGIYTGGTMNFFALGSALHVNPTIITFVYTFEMLVTFPLILFIVGGGYKLFRKLLPFADATSSAQQGKVALHDLENYASMCSKRVLPRTLLGLLLSIGFLAIGAGLSLLITGKLNELVVILTVTTLGITASFLKPIRTLPRTFEMGMLLILMFSVVVASQFDVYKINVSALPLLYFVLYVMLISVLLHLVFCRFVKASGDLFTVANVALLCSPPFIPPVVGAMGNKNVLISGIVIGLAGYAVGTYLGVGVAYLLSLF